MRNLFSKLFRRTKAPVPFDMEKAVGHFLRTLPRCTNRVLAVSRRYLDKRYNYELTVDAANLAEWAKKYEGSSWYSDDAKVTAQLAIVLWLRAADLTDNSVTLPPKEFFDFWSEHHLTFQKMPGAQTHCHECRQVIDDISTKITELPPREIFNCWRTELDCQNGHLLHQDDFGIHLCVRKNSFPVLDLKCKDELSVPAFLRKYNR